jgi:hypothetical protein
MSRWLAPIAGVLGLLVLVVGIIWAELDLTTTNGVSLVVLGALGLLLGAVLAGVHESAARRRGLRRS